MLFDCMGDKFLIGLNGSLAPVIYLGQSTSASGVKFDTFGVNVSSLAGRDVELIFSSSPENAGVIFDNIRFSHDPAVPEPSTYALFGLGAATLFWSNRRLIHRSQSPRFASAIRT